MKSDAERDLPRAERRLAFRRQQLDEAQQRFAAAEAEVARLLAVIHANAERIDEPHRGGRPG